VYIIILQSGKNPIKQRSELNFLIFAHGKAAAVGRGASQRRATGKSGPGDWGHICDVS
jgi:hypothetical protein